MSGAYIFVKFSENFEKSRFCENPKNVKNPDFGPREGVAPPEPHFLSKIGIFWSKLGRKMAIFVQKKTKNDVFGRKNGGLCAR